MRICHLINIGHEAGGAEKSVRMITDGLRDRGHTVHVIATDHRLGEAPSFADVTVPAVAGNPVQQAVRFFWNRRAYTGVRAALEGIRPDVVHLHTIGMFSPSVLDATRGYRRLLTIHGPEDFTLALLPHMYPERETGRGLARLAATARYARLRYVQRPAYRIRLRRLDGVLVPSAFYAGAVRGDVGRVPLHVVPNGIPMAPPAPLANPQRFAFVGRLEETKGVRVALTAFARIAADHPKAELVVVGGGPLQAELAEQAAATGVADRVQLIGKLPAEDLKAVYADTGVVLVPSVFPENFPTVAIEGLAAGRAIIGTAAGGTPELVRDGVNGLLVPPGDVDALAAAMDALAGDEARVRRMGEASAAMAPAYSLEAFLDRLESHYRAIAR
ncbi:Glycosyltransferase involved in cell wall bisynthesis [Pseudonocardia thermophila]|uniref:Glycosyltransferase involved in cell wall bisynthesis n=1 Tax=Pseudonocardia thermophila TaxID=1848 RepID=A0A1M6YUE1_PSETH|nr:glycosyltransferase family 4 protein [Pseudonocardia thermophila]SHL21713.1 Glycosyltransferase involved in cell wall bisynthesis [Pseudonocardia thermophila]